MKPTSVGLSLLTIKIFTPRSNQLIEFGMIPERIVLIIQRVSIKRKLKAWSSFIVFR